MSLDVRPHLLSELPARLLIEAEMNAAVHARVIDVLRDLPEAAVLKHDAGNCRIVERDEVMACAEQTLEHFTRSTARAAVRRSVAREARRDHERHEVGIAACEQIAVL